MIPCLEAAGTTSVVEVGAYAGDLTGLLMQWAESSGAQVLAVDPSPRPELEELAAQNPKLTLIREKSLDALPGMERTDAVIIDGDHNWWTVSEELRLVGKGRRRRSAADPAARRELAPRPPGRLLRSAGGPGRVPPAHRGQGGAGVPGRSRPTRGGRAALPLAAAREGGPRNGVLTAVEDFVEAHEGLRLAVIPAFFGLGWCGTGAPGQARSRRSWNAGRASHCSRAWRPTGCCTWPARCYQLDELTPSPGAPGAPGDGAAAAADLEGLRGGRAVVATADPGGDRHRASPQSPGTTSAGRSRRLGVAWLAPPAGGLAPRVEPPQRLRRLPPHAAGHLVDGLFELLGAGFD